MHACKKKFHDYDHDYDSNDENLMPETFMVMPQDLIMLMITKTMMMGDDYDYEFDVRKFHGNAAGLSDVMIDDDEEFGGMKFRGVRKNYDKVNDYCHYTGKYKFD